MFRLIPLIFVFLFAQIASAQSESTSQWQSLLTDSLDGWEVFTGVPHKTTEVPGFPKSNSEDCCTGTPVGLSDPLKIFSMVELEGEPALYVSGQGYAGISTKEEFENYHLTLEYKWGEKKFPPRLKQKRDAGLLIHCTGNHGAFWNVWLRSLECQIQETDTGDFIALAGVSAMIAVDDESSKMPTFMPDAKAVSVGTGTPRYGAKRSENFEVNGDWNRVDVFAVGNQALFAMNGNVVMRLTDCKTGSQDKGQPLTKGRIQLQSEAAELWYRRIKMKPATSIPAGKTIEIAEE